MFTTDPIPETVTSNPASKAVAFLERGIFARFPVSPSEPHEVFTISSNSNTTVSVSCKFGACATTITGDRTQIRKLYGLHFRHVHQQAASAKRGKEKTCMWEGCFCRISRGGRCQGQTNAIHPAHVMDMLTHIRQAHLKL
jgi:hypothetical protein